MKRNKRIEGLIGFILIATGLLISGIYHSEKSKEEALRRQIIGRVQKVFYDEKRIPTVQVHGVEYYLNMYGMRKDRSIAIGDSIYKERNDRYLEHYKRKIGGFYLFECYQID